MFSPRPRLSSVIYGGAITALFTWAAWLRIHAPLEAITDPDVWGYLVAALSDLTGHGFTHEARNFVYPAFLDLILRTARDFRGIVVAQHILGLLAGALMLAAWLCARRLAQPPALSETVHRWIG